MMEIFCSTFPHTVSVRNWFSWGVVDEDVVEGAERETCDCPAGTTWSFVKEVHYCIVLYQCLSHCLDTPVVVVRLCRDRWGDGVLQKSAFKIDMNITEFWINLTIGRDHFKLPAFPQNLLSEKKIVLSVPSVFWPNPDVTKSSWIRD